jgi:predicted O-methyltransferase YrrM
MNEARRRVAARHYAESHAFDEQQTDRLERFRNLEPESAELLAVIARAAAATRLLELGTSNGYSTLWLADAAEANGGRLVSVEIDPARSELATRVVDEANLNDVVELRVEDAATTLTRSDDCAWDLILLDAERSAYAGYLDDLVRTLAPGGLLAIDNVVSHERELVEFTAAISSRADLTQTVVAVGAGLRLAVKAR